MYYHDRVSSSHRALSLRTEPGLLASLRHLAGGGAGWGVLSIASIDQSKSAKSRISGSLVL